MTKTVRYLFIVLMCLGVGMIYYAWQSQLIIINIPRFYYTHANTHCGKRKAQIYRWQDNKWVHEDVELLWTDQEADDARQLVQATLSLLSEAQVLNKKIVVERVLLSYNSQQLLIFFDKSPFSKNMAISTKLMIIESILKTLRANGIKTPFANFFVDNQPLPDSHLDFTISWPLQGFCE